MQSSCSSCLCFGTKTHPLKACGKCLAVFYCSVACQKTDWSTHKRLCGISKTLRKAAPDTTTSNETLLEAEALKAGLVHFQVINPRLDRDPMKSSFMSGTKSAQKHSIAMHRMVEAMGLSADNVSMMRVIPPGSDKSNSCMMEYGRCFCNTFRYVKKNGGNRLLGWVLYENDFMVEAEAHAVWVPPVNSTFGKRCYVNVTLDIRGKNYSALFVPDTSLFKEWVVPPHTTPSNRIYWK
jgi:hypothetical protein